MSKPKNTASSLSGPDSRYGKMWDSGKPAASRCGSRTGAHISRFRNAGRFKGSIQPFSSRRTTCAITAMPASLSLRQGIAAKFFPPAMVKNLRILARDFLQRFEAIGGEARA